MADVAKGTLPDDFPGKAALNDAGVTSYGGVRSLVEAGTLTGVAGIGDVTATRITEALAAADAEAAASTPPANVAPKPSDAPVDQAVIAAGSSDGPHTNSAPTGGAPSSAIKVTCPECGVGGEVASEDLIGIAECGSSEHPGTKLVRA